MRFVLVADDHEVTRRGVRDLLREVYDGIEVDDAWDAASVLAVLPQRAWDLIILDINMPETRILDLIADVREQCPAAPLLMLTSALEIEYVVQTMKAGANGLIHKHRATDELLTAIKQVGESGSYLHPETAAALAATLGPRPTLPHERLSEREREIFLLIAVGRSVKEIAAELHISDKTVATYLARIREKTDLQSHVDIARYAMRHSLVR